MAFLLLKTGRGEGQSNILGIANIVSITQESPGHAVVIKMSNGEQFSMSGDNKIEEVRRAFSARKIPMLDVGQTLIEQRRQEHGERGERDGDGRRGVGTSSPDTETAVQVTPGTAATPSNPNQAVKPGSGPQHGGGTTVTPTLPADNSSSTEPEDKAKTGRDGKDVGKGGKD